jgi:hypothetical protein
VGFTGLGKGAGFTGRVTGCVGLGFTGLGEGAGFTGRVTGCVGLGLAGLTKLAGSLSGSFVTGRNLSNVSVLPGFASGLLFTAGLYTDNLLLLTRSASGELELMISIGLILVLVSRSTCLTSGPRNHVDAFLFDPFLPW